MSRQTKYELTVRPGITIKISLRKASDSKTGFKQGKDGRCLRTVRVLAVGDASPTCKDDIEQVIPWNDIESLYEYHDPETGEERYLPVDKAVIKSLYSNSNAMKVVGMYSRSNIDHMDYDGYHYFVEAQADSKTKVAAERDVQAYNLLYKGLLLKESVFLVRYVSSNREKFAYLYPQGEGLTLSNIYHSTYKRERERQTKDVEIPNISAVFTKLTESLMERGSVNPDIVKDNCEEKLRQYLEDAKKGTKKPLKFILKPKESSDDLFSQIMSL